MPGTFKLVKIVGTSPVGISEAIRAAVAEAAKTVRQMSWFEVVEQRGRIEGGEVTEYQVTIQVGFKIDR